MFAIFAKFCQNLNFSTFSLMAGGKKPTTSYLFHSPHSRIITKFINRFANSAGMGGGGELVLLFSIISWNLDEGRSFPLRQSAYTIFSNCSCMLPLILPGPLMKRLKQFRELGFLSRRYRRNSFVRVFSNLFTKLLSLFLWVFWAKNMGRKSHDTVPLEILFSVIYWQKWKFLLH